MTQKILLGSDEWVAFPDLNIPAVKARVDSGAATSSIHAYNPEVVTEDGQDYVVFDVLPLTDDSQISQRCKAKLVDQRIIKSSNGHKETRYVVKTPISLGGETWDIEMTLANRDSMGYRMLIGREAMVDRAIVDPGSSCVLKDYTDEELKELYKGHVREKKGLKIVLLASNENLYSNRRIMEAGIARGHEMIFVNVRESYMKIDGTRPTMHYKDGYDITDVDAIIPRLRPSVTFYGCAVTRQYESAGVFCLNGANSISMSRDKLRSLQILSARGVNMPVTGFANSPRNTKDLIEMVGGAPLIIKLLEGTQGKGVILAETNKAAESLINGFKSLRANFLVQEFIKEAAGVDLRCFVVDGTVVASIERRATDGDFRANLHLGGVAEEVKITPAERKMAVTAAKAMGLKVAGVDLLRTKDGPLILEVNSSPGLEGIERASGKDIASLMIDSIEKSCADQLAKVKECGDAPETSETDEPVQQPLAI